MEKRAWSVGVLSLLTASVALSASMGAYGAPVKKKMAAKKPASAMIAKGKGFVMADGCTGCHKLGGKGGASGPDLSKIGAQDKAAEIAAKLKNPKAKNPKSIMPPSRRPDKEIAAMAAYLASLK